MSDACDRCGGKGTYRWLDVETGRAVERRCPACKGSGRRELIR